MGLIPGLFPGAAALAAAFLFAAGLQAAPRLRLVSSTVGPVSIAQGANGSLQTVEAYNALDGSLNLSLSSSVSWITGSVGAQRACSSRAGLCTPLQFALNTSGLPAGIATGIVTVSDPNAVDAPQTITVTVQIGGAVPPPSTSTWRPAHARDLGFSTNSQIGATVRTNDGGPWLSLALDGTGSFRFSFPYRIHFAPSAAMAQGTYPATIATSGSSFTADNKNDPGHHAGDHAADCPTLHRSSPRPPRARRTGLHCRYLARQPGAGNPAHPGREVLRALPGSPPPFIPSVASTRMPRESP